MKIKRRTLELLKISAGYLGIFVIVFGGVYGYSKTVIFSVTAYDVRGIDDVSRTTIQALLFDEAKNRSLWIFPHNKIFTYSSGAIVSIIRNEIPDLATIEVRPVGLHTVQVNVTLLKPLFAIDIGRAVTEDGIIFQTKKDTYPYPKIMLATSTVETIKINGLPFDRDTSLHDGFLKKVSGLASKVSSVIFPVTEISVTEEGDVVFTDENSSRKVLFLENANTEKVWSTLVSAIDTDPLKTKLKENIHSLLYLDVRYGNKVFYKFSDGLFQKSTSTDIMDNHDTSLSASTTPSN
jgi:hypothetical protein